MMKVLVADDNPVSRELVREALEDEYSIVEAEDGLDALSKIGSERPDLVLLDLQMPRLDGFRLIQELRNNPSFRSLPAVALTAFAMQGDRERVLGAGFDAYVTKPVSLVELRRQVRDLLDASKSRTALMSAGKPGLPCEPQD